jgi:hypothetical protein
MLTMQLGLFLILLTFLARMVTEYSGPNRLFVFSGCGDFGLSYIDLNFLRNRLCMKQSVVYGILSSDN